LESSCIDVPRKKRVSKKRPKIEEENTSRELGFLKTDMEVANYWEDTYKELFGAILPIDSTSSNSSNGYSPYNSTYEPEPLILSEIPSLPQQSYSPPPLSITTMSSDMSPTSNQQFLPGPGLNDFSFLMDQIKELHESNRELANKLNVVTNELLDIRKDSMNDKKLAVLGGWHTFGPRPQKDLAISVWRPIVDDEENCSKNVLIEANNKFVELLGYPMEILKNNFSCTNMLRKEDLCIKGQGENEWPKRIRIITSRGTAEVFITITPIQDSKHGSPKYFITYMLEVD